MPVYGVSEGMTLSESIKASSWNLHEEAADSPYMNDLLAGRLSLRRYADLVAQHYFVYLELERAAEAMRDDPVAREFLDAGLSRTAALEADLEALLGPGWRSEISPTPATAEYCERLAEVCYSWPGGFVAHHYVRYLGDLSGGQQIRRVVERIYEITDHSGTSFYVFDQITNPAEFKNEYRKRLDAAPWPQSEQERIIDETLNAYRLNIALLNGL